MYGFIRPTRPWASWHVATPISPRPSMISGAARSMLRTATGLNMVCSLFESIQPGRIVDEDFPAQLIGVADGHDAVDQRAVVGHVRLHVGMRPVRAPQDATRHRIEQRAGDGIDVGVRR